MKKKKIEKRPLKKRRVRPEPDSGEDITSQSVSDQREEGEARGEFEELETADEKRFRLAQRLVEETKKALKDDPFFLTQEDQAADVFAKKTEAERRKLKVALIQQVKDFYDGCGGALPQRVLKGHRKPITAVVFSPAKDIYSVGKDGAILKFDGKNDYRRSVVSHGHPKDPNGHVGAILCAELSADGKRLLTGGSDGTVRAWEVGEKTRFVASFVGHKAAVHAVAFRPQSTECLSASGDRTLKIWEHQQQGLIQTLYGHKADMIDLATLSNSTAVSVSYDRMPIVWNLDKETQAQYTEQPFSLDCVAALDQQHFVAGGEGGELTMWNTAKKKPTCRLANAHATGWVSALATVFNSDLFASAANDGRVLVHRVKGESFSLELELPSQGVVNCLRFSEDGSTLAVVESQENRLGRWTVMPRAKCQIRLFSLLPK